MTEFERASLHNVAETADAPWTDGGRALHRVPAAVRERLNEDAQDRYTHAPGVEVRFVPTDRDASIEVELSAAAPLTVRPFWGAFQGDETYTIDREPRTIELSMPAGLRNIRDRVETGPFDPAVCRLRFDLGQPAALHGVSGPARPPKPAELPDRRLLVYGTSITAGFSATTGQSSYVATMARELGVDAINLGTAGSAFCEPAMAEYVASRNDWDAAVLSISVNMFDSENIESRRFTVEDFAEPARNMIDVVSAAFSDKPVLVVTLYPFTADLLEDGDEGRAEAYRDVLRKAVDDLDRDNLHLAEGPDVMDATGLTTDLLHPGDVGQGTIGRGLAERMAPLLDS